jgi:hypothetical protein
MMTCQVEKIAPVSPAIGVSTLGFSARRNHRLCFEKQTFFESAFLSPANSCSKPTLGLDGNSEQPTGTTKMRTLSKTLALIVAMASLATAHEQAAKPEMIDTAGA